MATAEESSSTPNTVVTRINLLAFISIYFFFVTYVPFCGYALFVARLPNTLRGKLISAL
jgi:hypothetical protein